MRFLSTVWHWFWFAQAALYPLLLVLMLRRKIHEDFPLFFLYVACASLRENALLVMNYAPSVTGNQYYAAYAASTGVLAALSLGVAYELFRHAVPTYPALGNLGVRFFRWGTIVLIVVAVALAWSAPAGGTGHVMSVFYLLKRTVALLLCGLLVLLFIFLRYFSLSWRSYSFGIGVGLGILTTADLAAYAIRSQIEPITRNISTDILDLITEGASLCSALVWTAFVLMREGRAQTLPRPLPEHDLETWNQELQRLLHQ